MNIAELTVSIEQVCPIFGVARSSNNEVRIDFKDEATPAQRAAARAIAKAVDWNAPSAEEAEKEALRQQLRDETEDQWLARTEAVRWKFVLRALKAIEKRI